MKKTIFSKIINRQVNAEILYQDNFVTAFRDKYPQAPIHILIVTNTLIPTMNDISINDEPILGRLFTVAAKMAFKEGISKDGYRIIVNCNLHGCQEIYHLHMHLLGGKQLGPMIL